MQTNWPIKKLGEIFERITESVLPTKYPDREFNYIGLENIESNAGKIVDAKPTKGKFIKSTKTLFRKNDVLYGKLRPYLNKVWFAEFDGICSTDIWVLKAKEKVIFPQLLWAILQQSDIVQKSSASMTGANLPRANKTVFDNIKIPLPPLAIQKQIVARLDKIAEARKLNDELIQKTDELFQSLLHQEINPAGKDWKVKKIKDVAVVKNGGTPNTKNPKYWNGKVLWLTPKELSGFENMEVYDTERKISDEGLKHSSATLLPKGTVLLTSRAPIGYIAIAGAPMATNQGFKNFVCDSKQLNNKFLYFFLRLKTKYLQSLGRGATFTEISKTIVEKIDIPLPPLKIQKQIVAKLSAVQEYKKQLLEQKSKLKELFDSVLHKLMNGGFVN